MGQACSNNTGDDSAIEDAKKKKDQQKDGDKKSGGADAPKLTEAEIQLRNRVMALFAKYEPDALVSIDPLMERLADSRGGVKAFIEKFVKEHGPEPVSLEVAVKECLAAHYKGQPDAAKKVDAAYKRFREAKPGQEQRLFEDFFGSPSCKEQSVSRVQKIARLQSASAADGSSGGGVAEVAGVSRGLSPAKTKAGLPPSPARTISPTAQKALSSSPQNKSLHFSGSSPQQQAQKRPPFVGTCDQDLRDRIMAMLVMHDVERLGEISEEHDFPDSEKGAELLYDLIETFGEEPASKKDAITKFFRELFEEHDPHRLRSVPTLVAAAMSVNGIQVVRKILRAYGVIRVPQTLADRGVIQKQNNASSPLSSSAPQHHDLREQPIIHAWATKVDGSVQKQYQSTPVADRHAIVSNYHRARHYVSTLDAEAGSPTAGAAATAVTASASAPSFSSAAAAAAAVRATSSESDHPIESLLDDFFGAGPSTTSAASSSTALHTSASSGFLQRQQQRPAVEHIDLSLHAPPIRSGPPSDSDNDNGEHHHHHDDDHHHVNEFLPAHKSVRHKKSIVLPEMLPADPPVHL